MIVVPSDEESLSDMIQCVDGTYATLFNALYGTTGHLWEGRFFSCVMDESHLVNASRYVELNPVRAGLVSRAEDYPWSSAAAHCGLRHDPLLSNDLPIKELISDWAAWLAVPNAPEQDQMLRERTESGYPCGSDQFVIDLEQRLGRRIRRQKSGRKPKANAATASGTLKFSNEGSDPMLR